MPSGPAEIVFAVAPASNGRRKSSGLFRYSDGPVKVPSPWKRGRPRGSANRRSNLGDGNIRCKPASGFEFVNLTGVSRNIDKAARTRIRRHAKLHQTPQNEKKTNLDEVLAPNDYSSVEDIRNQVSKAVVKVNLQQILGVDPFDQSPIKLEPYMHDLLKYYTDTVWKNFYTLEYLAGYNPVAEYWLDLAFKDPALIHIFIGCADAYSRGYNAIISGTKGLRHFYEAISLVNQRLQVGRKEISGTTLAIIAALAMLEKGAGRHQNWQVHMQGLKELVAHRGGLETLSSKPFVLNKIYRADLCGALDAAEPPYFDGPSGFLPISSSTIRFRSIGMNAAIGSVRIDQSLLGSIHHFEEAMSLWSNLDEPIITDQPVHTNTVLLIERPTSAQVARARLLLTEAQYTLVSSDYQQDNDGYTPGDRLSEYFRITLILYSITILHEPAPSQFIDRRIGDIFRRVYTELTSQSDGGPVLSSAGYVPSALPIDFHLWALFLAASVTDMMTNSETRTWLLMSFIRLVSPDYGNVHSWRELRDRLSLYLWIPSIHDQSSWKFWLEVNKVMEEEPTALPRVLSELK